MLFTAPEPTELALSAVPHAPERMELKLIARDSDTRELYELIVPYLRSSRQGIRGGATHRFDIAPSQIEWLLRELGKDEITHYRRQDATKPGYRKIYRMGIRNDGIIITSYYSAGHFEIDPAFIQRFITSI